MKLTDRFQDALNYAFELHRDQSRKCRKDFLLPYFTHLMAVTTTVLENGGSEDEAIAALLHDAIEDHPGNKNETRNIIFERFGEAVVEIVEGCSDSNTIPKPPWRDRKIEHLAKLQTASRSIILVSIADKLHNASSVLRDYQQAGEGIWKIFNGGKSGTIWHHRELLKIFKQRGFFPELTSQYENVLEDLLSRIGKSEVSEPAGSDISPLPP